MTETLIYSIIGITIIVFSGSFLYLYLQQTKDTFYDPNYLELFGFVTNYGGHFLSHLMFLNDKFGFWNQNKSVYFSLQKIAGKVVVLGDPIGDEASYDSALKELEEKCKSKLVHRPIFYQISSQYMSIYRNLNYQIIKIGEEAKVFLPSFTLEGKQVAKFRTSRNKFERNGFNSKVLQPPHSEKILAEIKEVSDLWLGNRNEKGFSVSYFDKDYISRFPIAVIINSDGKVIAFATLPSHTYKNEQNIHIDLMRYIPDSPNGTMDVLFTSIFLWAKEKGYDYCSLGMAPLSNVKPTNQPATLYEWAANLMYEHGEKLYKFKGLKEYKSKFATHWEPRYIAYQKTTILGVMLRIIALIHMNYNKRRKPALLQVLKRVS
ncbi:phosphatidylglycerol lysyltransferase domain-containing protein [Bacillus suaedaesalsae]|uniref:DUF2156 domain-containing protein n=1 Tax=Bacillus suaedaesalsae TaxID=2810349 RepID=A0ABS2DMT5_9BACI|nr:phosphatidylglycerol lysyltransferase domain-containing protein [Bacillus suaedaesalsae]MBM6619806.1 DUF2156 domain-containing protein [Bacillus suaedaesalsae]